LNDLEFAKLLNGLPDEMLSEAYAPAQKKRPVIFMISTAAACFAVVIAAALYAKFSMDPPARIPEPAATTNQAQMTTTGHSGSTPYTVTETALPSATSQTAGTLLSTAQTSVITAQTSVTMAQTSVTTAKTSVTTAQTSVTTAKTSVTTAQTGVTTAKTTVSLTQTVQISTAMTTAVSSGTVTAATSLPVMTTAETFPTETSRPIMTTAETFPTETSRPVMTTTYMITTEYPLETTYYEATSGYDTTSVNEGTTRPQSKSIVLSVLDEEDQEPVEGVVLQIYDMDGELLTELETDGAPLLLNLTSYDSFRLYIAAVPEGYQYPRRNRFIRAGQEEITIYLKKQ
jgi:hypothetical protein